MKRIWTLIDGLHFHRAVKSRLYLVALVVISILAGTGIWLVLGRYFFPGSIWLICFMGYPAVFSGFFGGILYLYNHSFT